ncbi:MAG: DUF2141 domain-containing protein [Verrucomicrobiota bacterium]
MLTRNYMSVLIISLCLVELAQAVAEQQEAPTITNYGALLVTVESARNDKGHVGLIMFNKEDGFPTKAEQSVIKTPMTLKNGKSQVMLKNLPYGEYAIAIVHDENKNEKLDLNWYGIPKEGYGASNNIKTKFGPPRYKDAVFLLDAPLQKVNVTLYYWIGGTLIPGIKS